MLDSRSHNGLLDQAEFATRAIRLPGIDSESPGADDLTDTLVLHLRSRDIPCPCCGYNLRDTSSHRCPECGSLLELHVGSPRAPLGHWILPLVAVAGSFGMALTMMAAGLIGTLRSQWWSDDDWQALVLVAAWTVASGLWLTWIIARRATVCTRTRRERWTRGIVTAAFALIAQICVVASIAAA